MMMNRAVIAENMMPNVYMWMFTGLSITASVSYGLFAIPSLLFRIINTPVLMFGLLLLQLGLVTYLSFRIAQMSYASAIASYVLYSLLSGISLAPIFFLYTASSIATCFISAAGMFGGMALYGYFTHTDLSGMRTMLVMGLWGLIFSLLINMYFQNGTFDYVISIAGILLFLGLTAYDVQKIKNLVNQLPYEGADAELMHKVSIIGALTLYLDFINLFLYLLRFMGKQRNQR